jgi:ketosteroid isomerase-like protein
VRAFLAVALLVATATAPRGLHAQSSYASDSAAIVAAARAFSAAYVRNDTMALGELYADSAVAFPPGRQVAGRAAIRHLFAWPSGYRQLEHTLTVQHLQIEGDLAVDAGTWASTGQRGEDPATTATGQYLVAWVREADGQWRLLYDMWQRPAAPK